MPEQENSNLFLLIGKLDGKLDGLMNSIQLINATFASHATSDDANFEKLRTQMAKDKEEVNKDRIKIARVMSVIVFLSTSAAAIAPIIIGELIDRL